MKHTIMAKILLNILAVTALLNACVTPKDTNFLQDISKDYPTDDIAPIDYKIIPGDQLALTIYSLNQETRNLFSLYSSQSQLNNQNTSLSGIGAGGGVTQPPANVLSVYSDGTIKIPYLEPIYVQDLTVLEAKNLITEQFKALYPDVTVDLVLRNRYFFVLGEAGSRAIMMSSLRLNIFQALAQSGAIKTYGDRKKVKIVRQNSTGTEVKTFDLRSKDIVDSEYYYIQPNDVIYVQQMQRKFFGAVTSFTSIFGLITGFAGMVILVIRLTK